MHLLISVIVSVHVISGEESLWNVPRHYIDAVKEWVVPTQSPMSTTKSSVKEEHHNNILLDPGRDPAVNKTEAWLDTMKRSIPDGWNNWISKSHEDEQTAAAGAAGTESGLWSKLREAWIGKRGAEKVRKDEEEKKKKKKDEEVKKKSKSDDTQIGTNSPPGNIPKKPSKETPKTKPPDDLDRLLPSMEVLNELKCRPLVSFMSCVDHCQQVIPSGAPLGPAMRRLEALDDSASVYSDSVYISSGDQSDTAFEEESTYDYRSLHDDAFGSAAGGSPAVPDFLVRNDKGLTHLNETGKVGRGGDRGPQVGGLLKKTEGWDALQASQLKSCLFNVCVVDYLKKAVPGCLGPDGVVVPLSGERDIRDPDLRPGRPEDFDTFDFYDPNRLEFWRHLGLFKWHRFWHEMNDNGLLRRLIFIPLLLAASLALPGLLVATVLPFAAELIPQNWVPRRPGSRDPEAENRPPPPEGDGGRRRSHAPNFCAALQGQYVPFNQDYPWTEHWRELLDEVREHPMLVAQRGVSWAFVNAAEPIFSTSSAVKRRLNQTWSFLRAMMSGVDDGGSEERIIRETEMQSYTAIPAGPAQAGPSSSLMERKSLVISNEESSQDFSTVPTVPDRD